MALQIHWQCSLRPEPYHHLHHHHRLFPVRSPKFSVKFQNPQIESESTDDAAPSKEPSSTGLGFGSSSPSSSSSTPKRANSSAVSSKKKQKGRREVIRRSPVEKPAFVSREEAAKAEEQRKNENAFLLAWLGLGCIILVEGILLATSGFLPDELDKFFVKYLYPVFTPTVGLFVAGTVAYGVLKYIQNEKLKR